MQRVITYQGYEITATASKSNPGKPSMSWQCRFEARKPQQPNTISGEISLISWSSTEARTAAIDHAKLLIDSTAD